MSSKQGSTNRPRVVIIRGDWLSKRDTMYYEPLMERFDLVGVSVRRTQHDLSLIKFPVVTPWSLDSVIAAAGPLQKIIDRLFRLRSENLMYFWGLDRICEGASLIDVAETFHPFCRQVVKIKQRTGVPVLVRAHENIPFAHSNLNYRRQTKQLIFQHADAYVTCSDMARHTLEIEGAPPDRINVIPMGLDPDFYCPREKNPDLMTRLGLSPRDFVVLFAARMVWEKGIMDILNAAARLKPVLPSLKVVVVGDGENKSQLNTWVAERGIQSVVRFTGRLTVREMPDAYSIADVVAVPSIATPKWQEQFGAVLIEAMSCRKPVIASDSGSIPGVVGDAGVIIPQANYVALANAIQTLFNDPTLADKLAELGREAVLHKFSNKSVANQLELVYNTLVTHRQAEQTYIRQ